MSPEEMQQWAFDNGVVWGRFKEQLENSEDVEWLRKRVLNLIDYLDTAGAVAEANLPSDPAVVNSVLIQSVRDRLTEEE